jgi:hypothetical protein
MLPDCAGRRAVRRGDLGDTVADDGSVGVEGIGSFHDFNANVTRLRKKTVDLKYVYNVTNGVWGLSRGLSDDFYFVQDGCWEKDLRSYAIGGLDNIYADDVDLFFIETHGNHARPTMLLTYDTEEDDWYGYSSDWHLGDRDLEWLALHACLTIDRIDYAKQCHPFMHGLHMVLGFHGLAWDSWTTEEVGRDVRDNLKDGDTICHAWLDGTSDWWHDQEAAIVSAEDGALNDWSDSPAKKDHWWGYGSVTDDIAHGDITWIGLHWRE